MSTPTRGLCIAGALVLGGLVSTQLWFKHSSNAQNSLWLMLSMGVFGDLLKPPKPLRGVPELCGNANPLHTLSWMNPIDFNSTTVGHLDHESRLHAAAPDAPIFVVGCGHSGTTELITLLDRHPLVRAYLDGPGMEFAIQPNSFDSPWGLLPVGSRRDDAFFSRLAARRGASHWAVKSPSNVCRIGYILKSLPRSRLVMMVRDGRDTMISLKERYPEAEVSGPLVLGRWINDNTAGLLFEIDPRLLVVRLEDFSLDPRGSLPRILAHVGVPDTWQGVAAALAETSAAAAGAGAELAELAAAGTGTELAGGGAGARAGAGSGGDGAVVSGSGVGAGQQAAGRSSDYSVKKLKKVQKVAAAVRQPHEQDLLAALITPRITPHITVGTEGAAVREGSSSATERSNGSMATATSTVAAPLGEYDVLPRSRRKRSRKVKKMKMRHANRGRRRRRRLDELRAQGLFLVDSGGEEEEVVEDDGSIRDQEESVIGVQGGDFDVVTDDGDPRVGTAGVMGGPPQPLSALRQLLEQQGAQHQQQQQQQQQNQQRLESLSAHDPSTLKPRIAGETEMPDKTTLGSAERREGQGFQAKRRSEKEEEGRGEESSSSSSKISSSKSSSSLLRRSVSKRLDDDDDGVGGVSTTATKNSTLSAPGPGVSSSSSKSKSSTDNAAAKEKKKKPKKGGGSSSSSLAAHDELRRQQVSQPLRPVRPKWPTKMTPEDKALFKAHKQAMRLLIHLGYANDTDW